MNVDKANKGQHWVICDICGQKTYSNDTQRTWNGFLACLSRGCWFPKHPADEPLPVIADPYVLPAETIRPSPNWDNLPALEDTGVSTFANILPPMNNLTWSQMNKKWSQFDYPVSPFDGTQDTP